jgi:hypothetical protein
LHNAQKAACGSCGFCATYLLFDWFDPTIQGEEDLRIQHDMSVNHMFEVEMVEIAGEMV